MVLYSLLAEDLLLYHSSSGAEEYVYALLDSGAAWFEKQKAKQYFSGLHKKLHLNIDESFAEMYIQDLVRFIGMINKKFKGIWVLLVQDTFPEWGITHFTQLYRSMSDRNGIIIRESFLKSANLDSTRITLLYERLQEMMKGKKKRTVSLSSRIFLYDIIGERKTLLMYNPTIPTSKVFSFAIPGDKQETDLTLFGTINDNEEIELIRRKYPLKLTSSGNKIAIELSYKNSRRVVVSVTINQSKIDEFNVSSPRALYYL